MHSNHNLRHDSGCFDLPCFTNTSNLPDPFSSDSESISPSSPHSFGSSSSSLASSPALQPTRFLNSPFPDLCLEDKLTKPSSDELSTYAANVIRAEAYALLALATRIAPIPTSDDGMFRMEEESKSNIEFRRCVEMLAALPKHGKIIVTGIGKSGIVARKMVATFNSLGESLFPLHSSFHFLPPLDFPSFFLRLIEIGRSKWGRSNTLTIWVFFSIAAVLTPSDLLGSTSVFLHPVEALHGDLGCICPCSPHSPCDSLLLISHSGATAELMRLIPIVRNRVKSLIAITSNPDSILAKACSGWLDAGTGAYVPSLEENNGEAATDEADSALPAPTSSVVAALAIGDAMALSLSRLRVGWNATGKERRQAFLFSHPGGRLGIDVSSSNLIS